MKLTTKQLRGIIKEEMKSFLEADTPTQSPSTHGEWQGAGRGPHDKRAPTEPVYDRETEAYIIDDIDAHLNSVEALEADHAEVLNMLSGAETPSRK